MRYDVFHYVVALSCSVVAGTAVLAFLEVMLFLLVDNWLVRAFFSAMFFFAWLTAQVGVLFLMIVTNEVQDDSWTAIEDTTAPPLAVPPEQSDGLKPVQSNGLKAAPSKRLTSTPSPDLSSSAPPEVLKSTQSEVLKQASSDGLKPIPFQMMQCKPSSFAFSEGREPKIDESLQRDPCLECGRKDLPLRSDGRCSDCHRIEQEMF